MVVTIKYKIAFNDLAFDLLKGIFTYLLIANKHNPISQIIATEPKKIN